MKWHTYGTPSTFSFLNGFATLWKRHLKTNKSQTFPDHWFVVGFVEILPHTPPSTSSRHRKLERYNKLKHTINSFVFAVLGHHTTRNAASKGDQKSMC
jgi:hypothetical protein